MNRETVKRIIRNGNFTISYHDNGCCTIYKGKHDIANMSCDEVDALDALEMFEGEPDGYYTTDVELLVEALGGVLHTI